MFMELAAKDKNCILWECELCDRNIICPSMDKTYHLWKEGYSNCCNSIKWGVWIIDFTQKDYFKFKLDGRWPFGDKPVTRIKRIS